MIKKIQDADETRYLYRAKRMDNGVWVEGNLIHAKKDYYICENPYECMKEYSSLNGQSYGYGGFKLVEPSTICQCTGLKDKNGKLIWENDICDRKEKYPEIVKYHDGDWTLDYSYASNNESGFNYCNLGFYVTERNCVEVLGNIFDNPELLEQN